MRRRTETAVPSWERPTSWAVDNCVLNVLDSALALDVALGIAEVNLLTAGMITPSSVESGHPVSAMLDGDDPDSYWQSEGGSEHSLLIDLGAPARIAHLGVLWGPSPAYSWHARYDLDDEYGNSLPTPLASARAAADIYLGPDWPAARLWRLDLLSPYPVSSASLVLHGDFL